jgi:phosphohistidine phosphatase SixA
MNEELFNPHDMAKKLLIICFAILGTHTALIAQNDEIFTIYLVRHSEKDLSSSNHSDLPLSPCGEQRSKALNNFLSDVHLEAVYSTEYSRTINTALPTSSTKGIEIQSYETQDLQAFAKTLLDRKQDALVVGHSNTTGVLAGILIDEEGGELSLDIYDRIYQVVFCGNSSRLHLLHSSFECDE